MKIFFFALIIPILVLASCFEDVKYDIQPIYRDEELTNLWASLEDVYNPSTEDFIKIQNYLKNGQRTYLNVLFDAFLESGCMTKINRSECCWTRILQNIKFIGNDQKLPLSGIHYLGGSSEKDKSKCIIFYASFNGNCNPFKENSYIESTLQVIRELEQIGYKGHVIYHFGGYPLIEKGSVRLMHVPYSFKVLSFLEAFNLGYKNVLWFDSSMHPMNNLEKVFSKIEEEGRLLLFNGLDLSYDFNYKDVPVLPVIAVESAGINVQDLNQIPHVIAGIIGISFQNQKSLDLIEEWYRLTSLTVPAMTLYPEEFLLSVSSWKTNNKPNGNVWDYFDARSAVPIRPYHGKKPFWFDKS